MIARKCVLQCSLTMYCSRYAQLRQHLLNPQTPIMAVWGAWQPIPVLLSVIHDAQVARKPPRGSSCFWPGPFQTLSTVLGCHTPQTAMSQRQDHLIDMEPPQAQLARPHPQPTMEHRTLRQQR